MIDEKEYFLQSGDQTHINDGLRAMLPKLEISHFGLREIFDVLDWLHQSIKLNTTQKAVLFRNRTAHQIILDGYATGCTDYALATLVAFRSNNVPAKYVETVRNRWLQQGSIDALDGHVFVEVLVDDFWYVIDPQERTISNRYIRHKVIVQGLDAWNVGLRTLADLQKAFVDYRDKNA